MQPKALIPMMTKSAHTTTVQYIANFDISASQSHFRQITENEMKKMLVLRMKTAHGQCSRLVQDLRSRETSCPRRCKIVCPVKHISRPWLALDQEFISFGEGRIVR